MGSVILEEEPAEPPLRALVWGRGEPALTDARPAPWSWTSSSEMCGGSVAEDTGSVACLL